MVLATLDVSYLYTNIPQTEGIDIICHHYEKHYEHNLPISTNDYGNFYSTHSKRIISNLMKDTSYKHKASLWELRGQLLSLLLLRQTEKNDCQWLGPINLLFGRDLLMIIIFSLWDISTKEVYKFVDFAITFHPTNTKFT